MSFEGVLTCLPGLVAGEDLSAGQYLFGKINTSGKVTKNATAGAFVDGVIQNKPILNEGCALASAGISKVYCGGSVTAGDRVMSDANGKAVTAAAAPTAATKTSSAGPFDLAAGDTMVIDVDNVGNATATWDAAAGSVTDTTSYAVTDQDGKTEKITIDGGAEQTVTFSGAHTTALQIAASINAQIVGASASVVGGQVKITSDTKGTGSSVAIGTGTADLTWDTPVAGTGDVVNIDAVTATEIKTVIEADTTADVTVNADGSFTISSPTTGTTSELDFKSGNALALTGLSVEVITGANPGTYSRGRALESGTSGVLIAVALNGPTLNG